MDLSKLKIEAYDLLAIIVPGFLFLCELWIGVRGWHVFALKIGTLTGTTFSIALVVSFAIGHVIQESADFAIKFCKGPRFFKKSRDQFWSGGVGRELGLRIAADVSAPAVTVDTAFDYCLTRIGDRFQKRDLFLANSDLARSLVVIATVGLFPFLKIALALPLPGSTQPIVAIAAIFVSLGLAALCWRRMKRFRELSEVTVFHVYLGLEAETRAASAHAK